MVIFNLKDDQKFVHNRLKLIPTTKEEYGVEGLVITLKEGKAFAAIQLNMKQATELQACLAAYIKSRTGLEK